MKLELCDNGSYEVKDIMEQINNSQNIKLASDDKDGQEIENFF